jgi:cob(I)alamin adenosyltransferase
VAKSHCRVEAYGAVDETNASVGLALADIDVPSQRRSVEFVMHKLYNCSSALAVPPDATLDPPRIDPADVEFLEHAIDAMDARSGPLTGFVLPTGDKAACYLHRARTVCRRAERRIVTLCKEAPVDPLLLQFINRASDFFFSAARFVNKLGAFPELAWDPNRAPG